MGVFAFDLERTVPFRHGRTSKVCLLQISTQNEDFVIDTLAYGMKNAVTNYLKTAFEDPQIIKVCQESCTILSMNNSIRII